MVHLDVLLVSGLLVAPVVSRLIYLDTTRRGLPSSQGLFSAIAVGIVSFGGFLVPHLIRDRLGYVYFQIIKPRPIAITPYEFLVVNLATGLTITALCLFLYLLSSRYGPA